MPSLFSLPAGPGWTHQVRPLVAARGQLLAGGWVRFDRVEVAARRGMEIASAAAAPAEVLGWAQARGVAHIPARLAALASPRAPFAGLALDRPLVMGIVNVTPDSFSDGGLFLDPQRAIAQGRALAAAGADILDIGGESTRPRAPPVGPEEEQRRILPVIATLAAEGRRVSVDTRHAATMRAAIAAGARIVNDVTALEGDPGSLGVVAAAGEVAVVLMHMQGDPATMQADPRYDHAPHEVADYLAGRFAACVAAGIAPDRIALDPGIGFGKTLDHNLDLLREIGLLHGLGCALLLGASRKSFIGRLAGGAGATDRLPGSLAAALWGVAQGVQILRVHDVAATAQALAVWRAIAQA